MRLVLNYLSLLFLIVVGLVSVVGARGEVLPAAPTQPESQFHPPDAQYVLGTDQLGRDNLRRLVVGSRISLGGALLATCLALTLGTAAGSVAGATRGLVDSFLMRMMDVTLSLPGIILAFVLIAVYGMGSWVPAVGVGLSLTPGMSRLVRALVLSIREQPFIEASASLGAGRIRIILNHILPNIMNPVIAFSGVIFAWSVLALASLEFLGLVGSPSDPSWGRMLADGRTYLRITPWIALPPGMLITAIVVSILRVSDWWRSR